MISLLASWTCFCGWSITTTRRSKYMAQSPKGGLIQGLYKPIHGNCAIYFYPGVNHHLFGHMFRFLFLSKFEVQFIGILILTSLLMVIANIRVVYNSPVKATNCPGFWKIQAIFKQTWDKKSWVPSDPSNSSTTEISWRFWAHTSYK